MAVAEEVMIRVRADVAKAKRELKALGYTVKKTQGGFKNFAKGLAQGFGIGGGIAIAMTALKKLTEFMKQSIKAASDAQEINSKFAVTFADVGSSAQSAAEQLAESYGLATSSAKDLLANTGDMLSGFGATDAQALELSEKIQRLSVDLASFTNYSGGAKGASEALTKAMLGEREQIKSLGIAIGEADVKQRLLEKGQADLTGRALRLAKAEATLELAYEQSQNAIGDYERTQDSYANATRRSEEATKALRIEVGRNLLPALGTIKGAFADFKEELANSLKVMNDYQEALEAVSDGAATFEDKTKLAVAQAKMFQDVMEKDIGEISPKQFLQVLDAIRGGRKEGEKLRDAFARMQEESSEYLEKLEEQKEIIKEAEKLTDGWLQKSKGKADAEERAAEMIKQQKELVENQYKEAWGTVENILDKHKSDLAKVQEQIDYLNKFDWGLGSKYEKGRQEALKLLEVEKELIELREEASKHVDKALSTFQYEAYRENLQAIGGEFNEMEVKSRAAAAGVNKLSGESEKAKTAMELMQDATQNWGQVMLDIAASGYIDTFKELGSALRDGRDSGEAFADSMADIGRAIMRELPRLLFYAGVQLLGTPAWPAGLALIVASGLTALASGAMEDDTSASDIVNNSNGGGGSQNNTTIVYVEGSVVSEAELTNVVSNGQSQNYGRY